MPRRALIYGWSIVAVGIVTALGAALSWKTTDALSFIVCFALAALASTFKLKLPGLTGTISPSFVFVLVAIGQLSWTETVLISAVSALVQSVWRPKAKPMALQLGFNASTLAIAGGLAHGVSHGLAMPVVGVTQIVLVAVAGLVLLITNTLLVSVILCLVKQTPLQAVWQALQTWAVPYYLAGGLLASVWVRTPLSQAVWVGVLASVSVYLLSVSSRGMLEQNVGRNSEEK